MTGPRPPGTGRDPAWPGSGPSADVAVAGSGTVAVAREGWRAVGAVVRGPAHVRAGRQGDDALAIGARAGWVLAVVADGAGSAAHGGEAAAAVTSHLARALADAEFGRGVSCRRWIASTLGSARALLAHRAAERGVPLATFRTTVLGALARGRRGLMFHIGDGAMIGIGDAAGRAHPPVPAISPAAVFEYAGETIFLTDEDWQLHLRYTAFRKLRSIIFLTDGVTPFALGHGGHGPAWPFLGPVLTFLERHPPDLSARALAALLEREDARQVSADDKTLLWLQLEAGEPLADAPRSPLSLR